MLVWLDESILNADYANDVRACQGVVELFNATFRGEHFVLGLRHTLRQLANIQDLPHNTRGFISRAESNLTQFGQLLGLINPMVTVTYDKSSGVVKSESDESWEVPLTQIAINGVNKCVLLAENIQDCAAYEYAAEHYRISVSLSLCKINIEHAGGGGSTIPDVLRNFTTNGHRWCLCITESDKFSPQDGLSLPARRCYEICETGSVVAKHVDLPVREIENLIPLKLFEQAVQSTHNEAWNNHRYRLISLLPEIHDFCDLKDGTSMEKIFREPSGSPRRDFWMRKITELIAASLVTLPCIETQQCTNAGQICECFVTNGFGNNILQNINRYLKACSAHKSFEIISGDLTRLKWLEIGKEVINWACAPPERIRC
jgi:hypothetical protein